MVDEFDVINHSISAASRADVIVLGAYVKVVMNRGSVGLEDRFIEFAEKLRQANKPLVLLSFGSPYLVKQFPWVSAYICAYGATQATQEAAAMLLFGQKPFRGTLPVTISLDKGDGTA